MSSASPPSKRTKKEHSPAPEVAERPVKDGFGSQLGRRKEPINLYANFYQLAFREPDLPIFHFDVEISPVDRPARAGVGLPRRLCWLLWENLQASHPEQDDVLAATVFDGAKNAYGPLEFRPSARSDGANFVVELIEPGVTPRAGSTPPRYNIRINVVDGLSIRALLRYTSPKGPQDGEAYSQEPEAIVAIQGLQTLIGHDLRAMYPITGGRGHKFYDLNSAVDLCMGGQLVKGTFQSTRPLIRGVSINLDVCYSAFVTPGRLDRVVYEIIGRGRQAGSPIHPNDWLVIGRILKGARLRLLYRGNPTYKLLGFSTSSATGTVMQFNPPAAAGSPTNSVPPQPPQQMSIAQYYGLNLNMQIQNTDLRLAELPGKQLVPLEFLELLPGHPIPFARVHPTQTQKMIKIASKPPQTRKSEIEQNRQRAGYEQSARMLAWGVSVKTEMAKVMGRVLDPPAVTYHPSSITPMPAVAAGAWNLTRSKFITPNQPLVSWAVLNLAHGQRTPARAVEDFIVAFVKVCQGKGMVISNGQPRISPPVGTDLLQSLKNACGEAYRQTGRDPQLVLFIVPDRNTYEQLKTHAAFDLKIPLVTQCVMADKVMQTGNRLDQYLNNVALKVNVKLGGENWTVPDRCLPGVSKGTIFLGADISHPGPGVFEPSVAAVVGSTGPSHVTYNVEIRSQDPRVELIHDMALMVERHLRDYAGGKLPDKIVMFRDGVSEGELDRVLDIEVDAVKKACRKIAEKDGRPYNPPLTFIICGKRHRVRFFASEKRDEDKTGNLPPGTIVTQAVVDPFKWDFYLQSHAGLIGTARPLHLLVLVDENRFSADDLQQMCHSLAFTFARATRSVSLCPPAYYADIACGKARVLIARDIANNPALAQPIYPADRFQTQVLERLPKLPSMWFM